MVIALLRNITVKSNPKLAIDDLGPEYNYKSLHEVTSDLPVDHDFTVIRDTNVREVVTGVLTPVLIHGVLSHYQLDQGGLHGISHWMRVRRNGLILAKRSGADPKVVELFSLFHDSQRLDEGWDESHGVRGAELAYRFWRDGCFELPSAGFEQLHYACSYHTNGGNEPDDETIAACWDADRLDLFRVGTRPLLRKLCSPFARSPELIKWCMERSENWVCRGMR